MKRNLLLTSALFSTAILASTASAQNPTPPVSPPAVPSTPAVRATPATPSAPTRRAIPVVSSVPLLRASVQDAPKPEAVDFAVPTARVRLAPQASQVEYDVELIEKATASQDDRGYLGIYMGQEDDGIRVTQIMDGGPADRAGLEAGDLIIKVAGKSMAANNASAMEHLQGLEAGDRVRVTLMRGEDKKNRWLRLRTLSDIQGKQTEAPEVADFDTIIGSEIEAIDASPEEPHRGQLIRVAVEELPEPSGAETIEYHQDGTITLRGADLETESAIQLGLEGLDEGLDEDIQKQLEEYLRELELQDAVTDAEGSFHIRYHDGESAGAHEIITLDDVTGAHGIELDLSVELDDLHEQIMIHGLGEGGEGHRIITLDPETEGLHRWLLVQDDEDGDDQITWSTVIGDSEGTDENVFQWVIGSDGEAGDVPNFFHEMDGDGEGGQFKWHVESDGEQDLWAIVVEDHDEDHGHDHDGDDHGHRGNFFLHQGGDDKGSDGFFWDVKGSGEAHGGGHGGFFFDAKDEGHKPKGLRGALRGMHGDVQGHFRIEMIDGDGEHHVHEGSLEDLHEHLSDVHEHIGQLHGMHPGVGIAVVEDEDGAQLFGLGYAGDDDDAPMGSFKFDVRDDDEVHGRGFGFQMIDTDEHEEHGRRIRIRRSGAQGEQGQKRIERIRLAPPIAGEWSEKAPQPRVELRRRIERSAAGDGGRGRWIERTERAPRAQRKERKLQWDTRVPDTDASDRAPRWATPKATQNVDANAELIRELRALREEIQELRAEVRRLRREVD